MEASVDVGGEESQSLWWLLVEINVSNTSFSASVGTRLRNGEYSFSQGHTSTTVQK